MGIMWNVASVYSENGCYMDSIATVRSLNCGK